MGSTTTLRSTTMLTTFPLRLVILSYTSLVRGPQPALIGAASRDDEYAGLTRWRTELTATGIPASAIAVLGRTARRLSETEVYLSSHGIATLTLTARQDDDPAIPGVRLAKMHRAKGLEFNRVAMIGMDADEIPPRSVIEGAIDAPSRRDAIDWERALVHVAATRARSMLRVSYVKARTTLL